MHTIETCLSVNGYTECFAEQANSLNNYGKQFENPFTKTYNPGWRNQPNFSWKNNQNNLNFSG